MGKTVVLLYLLGLSLSAAQDCIPLAGSMTCPAFDDSSISVNDKLTGLFPFLAFVSNAKTFDDQLQMYIATTYSQHKYQRLIGCSNLNLSNTTNLYARYTTSVLCNAIVQNSIAPCGLTSEKSRPLCADTCAEHAISEQLISSTPEVCGVPGPQALNQIRADFTNCALPADSIAGTCIPGSDNEVLNCGFQTNIGGLCSYCAESSPNATDSCCIHSNVESRCEGVVLPTLSSLVPLFPTATDPPAEPKEDDAVDIVATGLTGGQIAGIVVGSLLGAALLAGAIILFFFVRRRKPQPHLFNQPSPPRIGSVHRMPYSGDAAPAVMINGTRVARMAALEGSTPSSRQRNSPAHTAGVNRTMYRTASSEGYNDSPRSLSVKGAHLPKRTGSLSSNSILAVGDDPTSPTHASSTGFYSSPDGLASGRSEQLSFFKDYYSQDEIRPGDAVATLWAYQPRAPDEFELEDRKSVV